MKVIKKQTLLEAQNKNINIKLSDSGKFNNKCVFLIIKKVGIL